MMGILFVGRWPKGDPPAWAAGEARPWPSQAQMRAASEGAGGAVAAADGAPAPAPASAGPRRLAQAPAQGARTRAR